MPNDISDLITSLDTSAVGVKKKLIDKNATKNSSRNSTWSGVYLNKKSTNSHHRLNVTEIETTFYMLSLPIEERIAFYEDKYRLCMESETQLSDWIKNVKQKGPPSPLAEEKIMLPAKSKFSEILFSSVSTKSRSRHLSVQEATETTPTVRSSISTFLKKATGSLSTSYKQTQPKSTTPMPSSSYQKRFSFNRFSLSTKARQQQPKKKRNTDLSPQNKTSPVYPENSISRAYDTTKKLSSKLLSKKPIPSFEPPPSETKATLIRDESIDSGIKMSDSSSFLSLKLTDEKLPPLDESQSTDMRDHFPLASFPSIDSIHLVIPPSHSSSIPPRSTCTKLDSAKLKEESIFIKKAKKQQEAMVSSTKQEQQKKKNRASLLATSSLSTIRILSQKSQLLKR
ncbi:hypothetical protein EDC96DRAFT_587601 [Choanephora cucurbitarum]|nr:hypothetical protein EDC96DRAFT_587601 [Choanephora cucurbitarum]